MSAENTFQQQQPKKKPNQPTTYTVQNTNLYHGKIHKEGSVLTDRFLAFSPVLTLFFKTNLSLSCSGLHTATAWTLWGKAPHVILPQDPSSYEINGVPRRMFAGLRILWDYETSTSAKLRILVLHPDWKSQVLHIKFIWQPKPNLPFRLIINELQTLISCQALAVTSILHFNWAFVPISLLKYW